MRLQNQTLVAFLILVTTIGNSQSRENKTSVNFSTETTKLENAIGWQQNDKTGKWIENNNVIDDKECPSYWISHISQNFQWIQFKTIKKNDLNYHVFLYEKLGGEYKYKNIREDWQTDKKTFFFILTEEQYTDLKTKINLQDGENIILTSKMTGNITDRYQILGGEHLYNEENLLAKITSVIDKPDYSESCFALNSQITDAKEVLRFRLPEGCYSAEKYLNSKYFEVNLSEFKKILIE